MVLVRKRLCNENLELPHYAKVIDRRYQSLRIRSRVHSFEFELSQHCEIRRATSRRVCKAIVRHHRGKERRRSGSILAQYWYLSLVTQCCPSTMYSPIMGESTLSSTDTSLLAEIDFTLQLMAMFNDVLIQENSHDQHSLLQDPFLAFPFPFPFPLLLLLDLVVTALTGL